MIKKIADYLQKYLAQQVPCAGLGLFRICYGLVLFQEILFLLYFNHLIFDPIPFLDVEFPMVTFFLGLWGISAVFITIGFRTQWSTIINYIFWIIFVSFTPMQRDFDGGFDQFMTGVAFFLIFLPVNRAFSIDNLCYKLNFQSAQKIQPPPNSTTILAYLAPVTICLGFLYLDSGIHKLSSEHWRNGLGAWLPSTMPYYISAIDMSWLLNIKPLQQAIGYSIIIFQFTFLWLYFSQRLRPVALVIGICLHMGITLSFNIYPFGLGMFALYPLLVPFSWWRSIANHLKSKKIALTVFYDEACPLCNRTVIFIKHFDLFSGIEFKGLQTHAHSEQALQVVAKDQLLTDLYAVDAYGGLYVGLDTYIQVLAKMRYLLVISLFMRLPGVYQVAGRCYRHIADNRLRLSCGSTCALQVKKTTRPFSIYEQIFERYGSAHSRILSLRLAKIFMFIVILQFNSTLHYGLLYRLKLDTGINAVTAPLSAISNSVLTLTTTFFGITPHALYLHDHFEGYNHILGLTYLDENNQEQWLPFINEQGRIVAPNWGRVHSMWANIAVTPVINNVRLEKFIMKVTAFWAIKLGLDLEKTQFNIKMKKIQAPTKWVYNLRTYNLKQPWVNIGDGHWQGQKMTINLPENIDAL